MFFNFLFPLKYKKEIKDISYSCGIDPAFVASIIKVESNYKKNAISSKGAVGLMQIMPSTALAFGYNDFKIEESLKDPLYNIMIGVLFLKYLFDKYGDEVTVLACYNAGEGSVIRWLNGEKKLSVDKIEYKETYDYVNRVIRLKKIYSFIVKI